MSRLLKKTIAVTATLATAYIATTTFIPTIHASSGKHHFGQQQHNTTLISPATTTTGSSIPSHGVVGTNQERTFIAIKPDGIQRGLIAKIIARFEEKGFKLVAMKFLRPTEEIASAHYEDLSKKPFFPSLVRFFSSGPVLAMVWEGKGVIATGRRLLGETDPAKSAPGSIRGDYSIDIGRNIVHGSDSPDGAKHEINFWFQPQEIVEWTPTANQHIYE
jgi:nucleoside-diphosphate kinase